MTAPADPALRVGLVLEGESAPRWVHQAILSIQSISEASIALVLQIPPENNSTSGAGWRHAAYRLHRRLDEKLFPGNPDALEPGDIRPLLGSCPVVRVQPSSSDGGIQPGAEAEGALRSRRIDVLIDFRPPGRPLRAAGIAPLGIWSYRHGENPRLAARPPGYVEVAEGKEPLFSALVRQGDGQGQDQVLIDTWSTIHERSAHRTLDQCLPKLAMLPARALRRLIAHPAGAHGTPMAGDLSAPASGIALDTPYHPAPPGNVEVAGAMTRLTARYARDRARRLLGKENWRLACGFGTDTLSPRPDRLLAPAPGTFWADPFPIEVEDGYWVFFEEAALAAPIGYLSVFKMDRAGRIDEPRIILKEATHLSYPGVYRVGQEWYLLPESSAARRVTLYRATRFPFEWAPEEELLEGVRAWDPTLARIGERWWLFANLAPEKGSSWDELHLYYADRPQGPWRPHPLNPVVSDVRRARPAGHLFEHRGAWYRPAQDCGVRYGKAIVLNRIVKIDERHYEEAEVARILPDWHPRVAAVHTVNRAGDLTMFDCMYRSRRWES